MAGMDALVAKPITLAELRTALRRFSAAAPPPPA